MFSSNIRSKTEELSILIYNYITKYWQILSSPEGTSTDFAAGGLKCLVQKSSLWNVCERVFHVVPCFYFMLYKKFPNKGCIFLSSYKDTTFEKPIINSNTVVLKF
jgi:hypothetical protein